MEEETVICGNCGRDVPKTLYCIYCGSALVRMEQETKAASPPKKPAEAKLEQARPEETAEEWTEPKIIPPVESRVETEPSVEFPVDPEIEELMGQLRMNYIWKVRLYGILCDDGVSEEIFAKLFEEYVGKINQLNKVRNERIAYYQEVAQKKRAELDGLRRKLEELRVRAAVGQISSDELKAQTPELEDRIKGLATETSRLEAQLARLNDLMRGTSPKDVYELEQTARRGLDSLDSMITNGKISGDLGRELRKDLEAALNMFEGIIGDKKQREKDLRDQLATLEARYKVGEITISEFEAQKQRINAELEKIWI